MYGCKVPLFWDRVPHCVGRSVRGKREGLCNVSASAILGPAGACADGRGNGWNRGERADSAAQLQQITTTITTNLG